ncbi:MAG: DUF859 family phage minor structural protein [Protaetiibacter sp.]
MTLYTGTFTTPGTSAVIQLRLDVNVTSQSVSANSSTLSWNYYMQETSNANPFNLNHTSTAWAVVGSTVYNSGGLTYDFRATNATVGIGSGSITIPHNADGTKAITIAAAYAGGNPLGDASINTTLTLPSIARNRAIVRDPDTDEYVTCEVYVKVNGVYRPALAYAKNGSGVYQLCGGL